MSYGKSMEKAKLRKTQTANDPAETSAPANGVKVDGFAQVLAMLEIADPEFRESLLKRLAVRDKELAASLRADLALR